MQSTTVTFVSIDTTPIDKPKRRQTQWQKGQEKKSLAILDSILPGAYRSDWKIVFGHHPCFSGGAHSVNKKLVEKMLPIMKKGGVDMYLSGHDHNMQHWKDTHSKSGLGKI